MEHTVGLGFFPEIGEQKMRGNLYNQMEAPIFNHNIIFGFKIQCKIKKKKKILPAREQRSRRKDGAFLTVETFMPSVLPRCSLLMLHQQTN